MLGQRFLPTSYQAKLQQMDYEKHMKRLGHITKTSKSVVEEKEDLWRSTFGDTKTKHQKFQASEKLISIDKTNQVLLDKLVKISRNQKPPLFKATTWSSHPGTLNTGFRKMQLEKIALENEAMAKRLISQHGSVNRRQLDKDFEKHQEFSKNVQKISSPKIDKLLPIRSPKAQETPKGFKVKRKRTTKKNSSSVQMDARRVDQSKEDSQPNGETPSKEHMPTTHTQEDEAENLERLSRSVGEPLNQSNGDNVTVNSKELEDEKKEEEQVEAEAKVEVQAEAEAKVEVEAKPETKSEEETNAVSQREKEPEVEVKVETNTEAKAEVDEEEEKDEFKPQGVIQNKSEVVQESRSQVSTHRSKRSGTIQPPSNFEKARNGGTRKGSSGNIDSKSKSTVREVAQVPTTRSKNGMDKSQLEKSQVEKSQLEKSQLEKSQLEKSTVKSARNESQNSSPVQSQRQKEDENPIQNQDDNKSQIQSQRKLQQQEPESVNDQLVEGEQKQEVQEEVQETNQNKSQESAEEPKQVEEIKEKEEEGEEVAE